MNYTLKFTEKDFQDRVSVNLTEQEVNYILSLIDKKPGSNPELYMTLCKSLRSFY